MRLGIIFNFDPKWMGGIIYILNVVRVLNFVEDKDKPQVFLFYNKKLESFLNEVNYPYMEKIPWEFLPVHQGFVTSIIKRKNLFISDMIEEYNLDVLFPNSDFPVKTRSGSKVLSWYADLQHKYYPEFFGRRKIFERNLRINFNLKNATDLIVSSQAVKDDFSRFYKIPASLQIHVYHFVSVIEKFPENDKDRLLSKYYLPEKYFLISNQFHKHKNHNTAFRALAELKKNGKNIHFAVTGKFPEQPNSKYMQELHNIISSSDLKDNISFLGLISRSDQLLIMKYAQAIIQPSLFEGWSTVIEDAKSLQVPVIASNLPVNKEQLQEEGGYFEPHNYNYLAEIIGSFPERDFNQKIYEEYEVRMKKAAYELFNILSN